MRNNWIRIGLVLLGVTWFALPAATAQTDAALSIYGAFSGSTSGSGVTQSPSNAAGGLVELRHISNPIMGFEGTYSFNRANQSVSGLICSSGPSPVCLPGTATTVKADAHELTIDWVPSLQLANLKPFGVLGIGALFDVPQGSSGGSGSTQTTTKAVYVYGAGFDYGLLPHIGLRFQYRGNLYKTPDVSKIYTSVDAFTHTAEPMIGVYFRL